jgi:hypothetical protein
LAERREAGFSLEAKEEEGLKMKTAIALLAVVSALFLTTTANAQRDGKFIGTPKCTGTTSTNFGGVTCSGRVAGLSSRAARALLIFGTDWVCSADPTITASTTGNPINANSSEVANGRTFTTANVSQTVPHEELILGIDLGCPGDAWTAVRFTNVTIRLFNGSDISYNVGTVYP